MKSRVLASITAALLALAGGASAAPVTLLAGDVVVFNAFGTAAAPGETVVLTTGVSAASADVAAVYTFFPDFDAGGTPWSLTGPALMNEQDFTDTGGLPAPAGFLDGSFSFMVSVSAGSLTINPAVTLATQRDVGTVYRVTIGTPPTTVPEPAMPALLATVALAAAMAGRRRPV